MNYSASQNIRTYLKKRTLLFRYLVVVNLIFGAWYLQWRVTDSLNFNALWLAIPLLIAELYSYFGGVMFLLGLWQPVQRKVQSFHCLLPQFPLVEYPTVDVFITCYNEPVDLVEKTAQAALAIDYPVDKLKVYVLDDGNSPAMKDMSQQLCIQDMQSPRLQQAASNLEQERSLLESRLQQLQHLKSDLIAISQDLARFRLQVASNSQELIEVLAWFDSLKPEAIDLHPWLELQTILGEWFDNVLTHAHRELPPETPIHLELAILKDSLILKIWDRGAKFDLATQQKQTVEEIQPEAEAGRGIYLIQELSDFFSYTREGNGNCFVAVKNHSPNNHCYPNQSLNQLLLLSDVTSQTANSPLLHHVVTEQKKLAEAIHYKETAIRELARCRYIARPKPKGKPHHAKAGNINYAIFSGETTGDFIVTLDADHIPKPQFLQRVLPYFYQYNLQTGHYQANQIAFVQTPQAFYNLPPKDPFGHQAHLFYGAIQQGKDGMEAAFYTGTNAILRREALIGVGLQIFSDEYEQNSDRLEEFDLVGGVSSNSITEDMNTAMRLHAAGWKSVYHHEELSAGLAPDDLSSTLKQKLRWAQGTIQVLLRENPWTKPGLSFWQRLQYFQTMYSYFSGFFILIFLACPLVFFFTGIIPVSAYGADFAIHFIPAFVLNRLTFIAAAWGVPAAELWRSEQYAIALFPLNIQAVVSILSGKDVKFQVTPKQRQSGNFLGLVKVQLLIFMLTIVGITYCIYRFATGSLYNPWTYVMNSAWSIYNLSLLWVIIKAAVWQPKNSD